MEILVRGDKVTVDYPSPVGGTLKVLGPISFQINRGEFICVVGPSGCGKSTLLRLMAGLQSPTSGRILIEESPIIEPSRHVGMMFQDANLMPWRTVVENIALPLEIDGIEKRKRRELAHKILLRLGLGDDFADAYPAELSGGMAQRVALGRVLIQKPSLLLLDEPFGALDSMSREQITLDLLDVWSKDHQTIVLVTHDIDEAVLMADRVLVFSQRPGQIVDDIEVMLPRPRHFAESYTEAFGRIARRVRTAIHTSKM